MVIFHGSRAVSKLAAGRDTDYWGAQLVLLEATDSTQPLSTPNLPACHDVHLVFLGDIDTHF